MQVGFHFPGVIGSCGLGAAPPLLLIKVIIVVEIITAIVTLPKSIGVNCSVVSADCLIASYKILIGTG